MFFINTKLTRLLGIRTPVISAPMAGASGGDMAAAVTNGGGFGFLAAGYDSVQKFTSEIEAAQAALTQPSDAALPIGIGFLAWQLEKPNAPALELLSIALKRRVQAIWLAFGENLGQWVEFVRKHDAETGHKTIVFVQVSSTDDAKKAMNEWKADVIVAQGVESGGHGHCAAPPVMNLVSSIISSTNDGAPPILAAGGLANGAHVASFLTLGADGAVLGTRFLLTPESLYTDAQRQALLSATDSSTARTMAFDRARGTLGWPKGVDGRGLYNDTVKDVDSGVDMVEVQAKFSKGVAEGDPNRMLVWAGTGVGLMSEIKPAKNVVQEIHQDIIKRLNIASGFVVHV
ncbi:2-nitropropane dioxygenase [Athelia psychrophila]|uniref:2-nitropropane dioxygenase n=1 Tax=Athelia psychrophila TaxID=1759441 RepID=A0A166Q148_9AGAM|nr:2-nitropropane dioxygenase [Fibularhizoctonia sp. CBS 109695]